MEFDQVFFSKQTVKHNESLFHSHFGNILNRGKNEHFLLGFSIFYANILAFFWFKRLRPAVAALD
jgi:hypothetical protein